MVFGLVRWVEWVGIIGGYCKQSSSHYQAPPNNRAGGGVQPMAGGGVSCLALSIGGYCRRNLCYQRQRPIIPIMFNGSRCCGSCEGARGGTKVVPVVVNIIGNENPGNISCYRPSHGAYRQETRSSSPVVIWAQHTQGCC